MGQKLKHSNFDHEIHEIHESRLTGQVDRAKNGFRHELHELTRMDTNPDLLDRSRDAGLARVIEVFCVIWSFLDF